MPSRWWPSTVTVSPSSAPGWSFGGRTAVIAGQRRAEVGCAMPLEPVAIDGPRRTGSAAAGGRRLDEDDRDWYAAVGRYCACSADQSFESSSVPIVSGVILISSTWRPSCDDRESGRQPVLDPSRSSDRHLVQELHAVAEQDLRLELLRRRRR